MKRRDIVAGCRTDTQRAKHIFSLNGFNEIREKENTQRVSTKRERSEQHSVCRSYRESAPALAANLLGEALKLPYISKVQGTQQQNWVHDISPVFT